MSKKSRSKQTGTATLRAELSLDATGKAPAEIRLLRAGPNETDYGTFVFDELAAAMVMASFEMDGKPRLMGDWNHGMLDCDAGRDRAAACCSFVPMVKAGDLFASDIKWTADGTADIEERRYNYFSPAFTWEYGDDGQCRPRKLINFALVNLAGLHDIDTLLAAGAAVTRQQEQDNMDAEKQVIELTAKLDAANARIKSLEVPANEVVALSAAIGVKHEAPAGERLTAVQGLVALSAELVKLTGKDSAAAAMGTVSGWKVKAEGYDKLAAESAERDVVALKAEVATLLEKGDKDGKVPPAAKASLEAAVLGMGAGKPSKEGIAWLSAHIEALPKLVNMVDGNAEQPKSGTVALTAAEEDFAKRHGKDPVLMLKAKQDIENQFRSRERARS